jgi:hypothetical protein
MSRSMLYAFDGTWNDDSNPDTWTNVYRLATCLHREHVRYFAGVGSWSDSGGSLMKRLFGGAFGAGLSDIVRGAFSDWRRDRENGVNVIDIIGFSRGAMAAVDFAGKIREFERDARVPAAKRMKLRFLGLFDAVDAIGAPDIDWDPFYHRDLPGGKGRFTRAVHAVALHETRTTFQVVDIPGMDAVVGFIGGHSDIGGGWKKRGLSQYTLQWMYDQAAKAGVRWDRDLKHCSAKADDRLLPHRILAAQFRHQPRHWPEHLQVFSGYPHWRRAFDPSNNTLPYYPLMRQVVVSSRIRSSDKRPVPHAPVTAWEFVDPDGYTKEE